MQSTRETKALSIIEQGYSITRVGKNHYRVLSQSNNNVYNVKKTADADVWSCDCKDFTCRLIRQTDKKCKHILSCIMLRDSIETQNKIEKVELPKVCPRCYSTTICKNGLRKIKNAIKRQRYVCKRCQYKFIIGENGFSKVSSDPKIITEALNLIFSSVSYRNVARHIRITYHVKISHVSVLNWLKKYTQIMKEYVDSLKPQTSDVWSLDEMMLNVKDTKEMKGKGFYDWLWTIIDPQTRFVIATEVSKRREIADARKILESGIQKSDVKPSYVITDSLNSYQEAIRKELDARKTVHIKTKSLQKGFQNRPIERYHNEIREKLKTRRGLGNDESAQVFADGYRIYHNYCRTHSGLDDMTPAEAAKIDLNLGENKIHDLITKSTTPNKFVNQLGKRIEKVNIVNEGDCIKVSPKMWIEKQVWREINDILRLHSFSWLSNGKESCWMKLLS